MNIQILGLAKGHRIVISSCCSSCSLKSIRKSACWTFNHFTHLFFAIRIIRNLVPKGPEVPFPAVSSTFRRRRAPSGTPKLWCTPPIGPCRTRSFRGLNAQNAFEGGVIRINVLEQDMSVARESVIQKSQHCRLGEAQNPRWLRVGSNPPDPANPRVVLVGRLKFHMCKINVILAFRYSLPARTGSRAECE